MSTAAGLAYIEGSDLIQYSFLCPSEHKVFTHSFSARLLHRNGVRDNPYFPQALNKKQRIY
jgi:hypothetical protein